MIIPHGCQFIPQKDVVHGSTSATLMIMWKKVGAPAGLPSHPPTYVVLLSRSYFNSVNDLNHLKYKPLNLPDDYLEKVGAPAGLIFPRILLGTTNSLILITAFLTTQPARSLNLWKRRKLTDVQAGALP